MSQEGAQREPKGSPNGAQNEGEIERDLRPLVEVVQRPKRERKGSPYGSKMELKNGDEIEAVLGCVSDQSWRWSRSHSGKAERQFLLTSAVVSAGEEKERGSEKTSKREPK